MLPINISNKINHRPVKYIRKPVKCAFEKYGKRVLNFSIKLQNSSNRCTEMGFLFDFHAAAQHDGFKVRVSNLVIKLTVYVFANAKSSVEQIHGMHVSSLHSYVYVILFSQNSESYCSYMVGRFHSKRLHLNFPSLNHCSSLFVICSVA